MRTESLNLLRAMAAVAVLVAAAPFAHAGGPVYYSVDAAVAPGLTVGVSNVPPPPVYVQPAPVIVAPRPVYVPQPVYVQQAPYVVEYEGEHEHGHRRHEHEHRHHHHDDDD